MNGGASLRVAIVGSGPSGVYATAHLLQQFEVPVRITMFERLPTPWGLVRGGVAPDHPEKKLIARSFERVACHPDFRFLGNVEVGRDISVPELREQHDAVILACGAAGYRTPQIPGETLPGCSSAAEFVGWYNGHPDHSERQFDLSGDHAIVVGNGNVALDIARILTLPVDLLARTDIAPHALAALERSAIRQVTVLGRRSALHASFNNPELEELGRLTGVDVAVSAEDLPSAAEVAAFKPDWTTRRKLATLADYAARPRSQDRSITLRFQSIPRVVTGDDRCTGLGIERNLATGGSEALHASQIFFAIGFRGQAVADVPFDPERGIIPNQGGRVMGADMSGVYACGWIARGPSGVIGSNKLCALRAVSAVFEDWRDGRLSRASQPGAGVETLLKMRDIRTVSYRNWQSIDDAEIAAASAAPRRKFTSWQTLLQASAG